MMVALVSLVDIGKQYNDKFQFVGLSRFFLIDISKKFESHTATQDIDFTILKKFFEFFMRKNLLHKFLCFCADFVLNG